MGEYNVNSEILGQGISNSIKLGKKKSSEENETKIGQQTSSERNQKDTLTKPSVTWGNPSGIRGKYKLQIKRDGAVEINLKD